MEIRRGYGVVEVETIGPDATPVRALPVRVVPVIDVKRRTVKRLLITIVTN
jgi:hypothetical protein